MVGAILAIDPGVGQQRPRIVTGTYAIFSGRYRAGRAAPGYGGANGRLEAPWNDNAPTARSRKPSRVPPFPNSISEVPGSSPGSIRRPAMKRSTIDRPASFEARLR